MGKIFVEDIRCYAYHGCMDEEGVIGTNYSVNVVVSTDLSISAESDKLSDTVDYVSICKIVQDEMAIRSKLIEHVGKRILNSLMKHHPSIGTAKITLTKHKPPIHGDVSRVSVEMESSR